MRLIRARTGRSTVTDGVVQDLLHPISVFVDGVGLRHDLTISLQRGVQVGLSTLLLLLRLTRHFLLRRLLLLLFQAFHFGFKKVTPQDSGVTSFVRLGAGLFDVVVGFLSGGRRRRRVVRWGRCRSLDPRRCCHPAVGRVTRRQRYGRRRWWITRRGLHVGHAAWGSNGGKRRGGQEIIIASCWTHHTRGMCSRLGSVNRR